MSELKTSSRSRAEARANACDFVKADLFFDDDDERDDTLAHSCGRSSAVCLLLLLAGRQSISGGASARKSSDLIYDLTLQMLTNLHIDVKCDRFTSAIS